MYSSSRWLESSCIPQLEGIRKDSLYTKWCIYSKQALKCFRIVLCSILPDSRASAAGRLVKGRQYPKASAGGRLVKGRQYPRAFAGGRLVKGSHILEHLQVAGGRLVKGESNPRASAGGRLVKGQHIQGPV